MEYFRLSRLDFLCISLYVETKKWWTIRIGNVLGYCFLDFGLQFHKWHKDYMFCLVPWFYQALGSLPCINWLVTWQMILCYWSVPDTFYTKNSLGILGLESIDFIDKKEDYGKWLYMIFKMTWFSKRLVEVERYTTSARSQILHSCSQWLCS